jgi:hypothetical protein
MTHHTAIVQTILVPIGVVTLALTSSATNVKALELVIPSEQASHKLETAETTAQRAIPGQVSRSAALLNGEVNAQTLRPSTPAIGGPLSVETEALSFRSVEPLPSPPPFGEPSSGRSPALSVPANAEDSANNRLIFLRHTLRQPGHVDQLIPQSADPLINRLPELEAAPFPIEILVAQQTAPGAPLPTERSPNLSDPSGLPDSTLPSGTSVPQPLEPDTTVPPDSVPPIDTSPTAPAPDSAAPSQTVPESTSPIPDPATPAPTTPSDQPSDKPPRPADVEPGRRTSSGSSYIGIGGNIGIGDGDTQIGQGSAALISKIGLLSYLSVRPSILFSDDLTILLPVTYDFNFGNSPLDRVGFRAAPYVGAGAVISTDEPSVDLLLTGGLDVPITERFTGTAAVNASVTGSPAVGLMLGVGYNF